MCAFRDVYTIEIGNTVNSLIRSTKAQYQVCAFRDVYAIEIGNTVNSNTDYKGQYKCAYYGDVHADRDKKYS